MSPTSPRLLAIIILIPFTLVTLMAIVNDGTNGFPNAIFYNLISFQIWFDLVIAMLFWCAWLLVDAKVSGRNPWPWIVAALLFGAFAPLIYMIVHQSWPASSGSRGASEDSDSTRRSIAAIGIAILAVITMAALAKDGTDIPSVVTHTWSNFQIWLDLVITILLWVFWLFKDANQRGANPWGWLVYALALGSFAPLTYLAMYGRGPSSHPPQDSAV